MKNPNDIAEGHNPNGLTNAQVGKGYRLTTEQETDGKQHAEGEWWDGKWLEPSIWGWYREEKDCIRIPT